jgi:hypothetical protein
MQDVNLADSCGEKRVISGIIKLINMNLRVTTRISENCIGASMNLRKVTSLEIIQSR